MSQYDAMFGAVSQDDQPVELGNGFNFKGGLLVRPNATTGMLDIFPSGSLPLTITTASFVQPAASGNVSVQVVSSSLIIAGGAVLVAGGGAYTVASVTDATHVVLTNQGLGGNAAPGITVASNAAVVSAGAQGPAGAAGPAGAGINYRQPRTSAKLLISSNVSLSSTSTTVDGVSHPGSTVGGHTFFLSGQTNPAENGLYYATSLGGGLMSLTRITALDTVMATGSGLLVTIREGTVGASKTSGLDYYINAANAISSTPTMGLSVAELDVEDFWIPADGADYANAHDRAAYAMQLHILGGTINYRRQSLYTKSRYNHVPVGMKIKGKGGAYAAIGTIISCATGGFIFASSDGGASAAGAQIDDLAIQCSTGASQAKDWCGIEANQAVRLTNVYVYDFPGDNIRIRGKTSDDRGTINAAGITTTASFVVPAHGATVQIQFNATGGLRVGTFIYVATAGLYRVVTVDDATHATCMNVGSTLQTAYQAPAAAAGVTIATAKAITGIYSNVDHSELSGVRSTGAGCSGFFFDGDNCNQINLYGCDATANGIRALTGRNYGFYDNGFLGNHYHGCHSRDNSNHANSTATTSATFVQPTATNASGDLNPGATTPLTVTVTVSTNTVFSAGSVILIGGAGYYSIVSLTNTAGANDGTHIRVNLLQQLGSGTGHDTGTVVPTGQTIYFSAIGYLSSNNNARSTYTGCYNENGDVSVLQPLCVVNGGHMNNLIPVPGINGIGNGLSATYPLSCSQGGLFGTSWSQGVSGSNVIEKIASTVDPLGYTFQMPATSLAPTLGGIYAWQHQGQGSKTAMYLTGAGYANQGPGFLATSRFLVNGVRLNCWALGTLPATNTTLENYFIGDYSWNAATTGAYWFRIKTAVAGNGGALTWESDRVFAVNQNPGFSATLAALTEETKTITLTGAVVGQAVQVNPRGALPSGIQIDYTRVSAAGTVEVRIYNRLGVGTTDCSGIRLDASIVTGAV